jgi:hypothetical protein
MNKRDFEHLKEVSVDIYQGTKAVSIKRSSFNDVWQSSVLFHSAALSSEENDSETFNIKFLHFSKIDIQY